MAQETINVISDLHISSGPLDDCDEHLQGHLVDFLHELAARDAPVELIINGDFLDFAQAAPWKNPLFESVSKTGVDLCFTEEQSVEKLGAIVEAHKPIFEALGKLIDQKAENRIVILPGNHDPDFFWPQVQSAFVKAVCEKTADKAACEKAAADGKRIVFHLERAYRPPKCQHVWIEHGNHHDPNNFFMVSEIDPIGGYYTEPKLYWGADNPPIFEDVDGVKRLYECVGTRFMIRYMNLLDEDYPFVDNVKPLSRFITIFGASAVSGVKGSLKAVAAVWGMTRFLGKTATHNFDDLLSLEAKDEKSLSSLLEKTFKKMPIPDQIELLDGLAARGLVIEDPLEIYVKKPANAGMLMDVLAADLDLVARFEKKGKSLLSLSGGDGTLSLAKGFVFKETAALRKAAAEILKQDGVEFVVMGHTHEKVEEAQYVNTGCWTRYYTFADKEPTRPWSVLKDDSYESFPYQLNYAEIVPGRTPPVVLKRHGGPES